MNPATDKNDNKGPSTLPHFPPELAPSRELLEEIEASKSFSGTSMYYEAESDLYYFTPLKKDQRKINEPHHPEKKNSEFNGIQNKSVAVHDEKSVLFVETVKSTDTVPIEISSTAKQVTIGKESFRTEGWPGKRTKPLYNGKHY